MPETKIEPPAPETLAERAARGRLAARSDPNFGGDDPAVAAADEILPLEIAPPVPRQQRRPSSATRPSALPRETPTWSQIEASPKYRAMSAEDRESVRASFWSEVVLPRVPVDELDEAKRAFDERTKQSNAEPPVPAPAKPRTAAAASLAQPAAQQQKPAQPAKVPKVPTWSQVEASPKYQVLDEAGKESVRMSFWRDVVSPRVPTPELEQARKAFDERTKPAEANWFGDQGVLTNAPAGMVAAGKNAVANLAWMSQEGRRQQLEHELQTGESPELRAARSRAGPPSTAALTGRRPEAPPIYSDRPPTGERARALKESLDQVTQVGEQAKRWADETRRELQLVTPAGEMDTAQQAVWSLVQSAPPTLMGISVGILTRNPVAAMAIAGGGGGGFQAGSTYGEARAKGASHDVASRAAAIDGVLEGIGEALPLKFALKPGSVFLKRLASTIGAEAGQEGVTQLAQDLNAYLSYDPNITLQDAWQNFKVATLAGALGGAVYSGVGAAAERGRVQTPPTAQRPRTPGEILTDPDVLARMIAGETVPEADAILSDPAALAQLIAEGAPAIEPAVPPAGELTATTQEPGAALESPVDEAAHVAATSPANELPEPTEAQIDAGNYRKGHVTIGGLDVSIENPEGSERSGVDPNGKPWSVTMKSHYGYIRGSRGKDKEHIDAFIKPGTPEEIAEDAPVYVVDQRKPGNGHFDEHKVMLGFESEEEARRAYLANYTKGWQGIQAVTRMPLAEFKRWIAEGDTTKPAREHRPQLEARRAVEKGADAIAAHALAGRGFASIAEAKSFATERIRPSLPAGTSIAEYADQALELGTARAAESLESRMRERGATKSEIDLARRGLYTRLPEPSTEGGTERPAVGIALNPPYTGTAGEEVTEAGRARPDVIRQAIRDLFRVPINEGGFKTSRDVRGLYKVKPQTIRVRNQNDIGVIAHETGHHFSETSRKVRELMTAHEAEIRRITPYAASQRTAALQREEGFAEYLRLRWTQPAHAKAAAPGFSAAFEKYVDENDYRPAFDAIEGAIRDWQNLPPAERILAKVGEPGKPLGKRVNLDRIVFEVFDRWLPMQRMVENLKPDVAASADPFKLAHLLAGDAAIIENWLLRESVPFSFARRADPADRGKPLSEILKPIEKQQREFGAYLIARRANELMKRGKEHLYSQDEINAGLRLETPEFKAAAAEVYAYNDRLLDYAVEGGLLAPNVADRFRQFPFYVPFFRVGEPISQRGDIFQAIRGGTENLRDPIANVIENTLRVIHATNRNYVLAKAHDLAREVPGGGRWIESVPIPERAVKLETQKIIEQLREQGVEIDTEAAEALATSQTFFVKNPFGDDRDRIIVVRRSGRAYALQVNDEMLWEALERFEPVDIGLVEKILSVPADVLRAGIVLSPEFMARNFARDTLSGFLQSKKGLVPVASTLGGFKEIATRSDAARLYRAFGGGFADMWRADRGLERKLVERMARHGGFDPRTIVTPRGLLSLLHRFGSATEAGTRVAEFKRSMGESGVDELIDAAYNAREVSVDFGMHGHSRSVRFITRIVPFLNPAMQSIYKAVRTGGSAPFTTLLRGGMLTAASIALFLANRDEDWYDELELWEKNVYWHVDIGLRDERGKVIALRIPKPWEWGAAFGSIPEAITEVAIEQHGKPFLKRLKSIMDDVFSLRVIPTSLLVPAELWANKSVFYDRPIVPQSKQRLPAELQATSGTSLAARKAGELTGAAPAKIDHAVRGLFGTLGVYSMMLADQAISMVDDEPAAPPLPWQRSPLVRVFFGDPGSAGSRYVTELYELLTEAREAEAALRLLEQEEVEAFVKSHETELGNYPVLAGAAQLLAALRRENERILRSRVSPEEKSRMVRENNARIKAIAKTVVQRTKQPAGMGANR